MLQCALLLGAELQKTLTARHKVQTTIQSKPERQDITETGIYDTSQGTGEEVCLWRRNTVMKTGSSCFKNKTKHHKNTCFAQPRVLRKDIAHFWLVLEMDVPILISIKSFRRAVPFRLMWLLEHLSFKTERVSNFFEMRASVMFVYDDKRSHHWRG